MFSFTFIENIPNKIFPKLRKKSYPLYVLWREICHIIGSFILMEISHIMELFIPKVSLFFFILLILWMTYQEFYVHPRKYNEEIWRSTLDWFSWVIPFGIYIYIVN